MLHIEMLKEVDDKLEEFVEGTVCVCWREGEREREIVCVYIVYRET